MAFNKGGEHFRSGSAMRMAERGGEEKAMEHKAEGEGRESEGAKMTLEHDGAGGMHSTDEKGERTEHPTLGHALMHFAHHVEPGSKHEHVAHDGYGMESHGVNEKGEHHGPDEHEDVKGLADHMGQMFGEEAGGKDEGEGGGMEEHEPPEASGLY